MTIVDHEKLRRGHPLSEFGRPSFTEKERVQLRSGYRADASFRSSEACAVEDHRLAERKDLPSILSHEPSPHHPCPLCRAMAMEKAVRFYAEAGNWLEQRKATGLWPSEADMDRGKRARAALGFQVDTPAEGSGS